MPNDYFQFKQFTIRQDRCALKVGTDGMLLGAWTRYANALRILDIGTGTGVLALIAAQRNNRAVIDAVEIDREAMEQARENVAASPWPDRIRVHWADVRNWKPAEGYDLVLCNPPFFKGHLTSHDPRTALAKHEHALSLGQLVREADRFCNPHGRLCMIMPLDRLPELKSLTGANGFVLSRECLVSYRANKRPKRVLVELSHTFDIELMTAEMAVEREPGEYTLEYKALLRDLKLRF